MRTPFSEGVRSYAANSSGLPAAGHVVLENLPLPELDRVVATPAHKFGRDLLDDFLRVDQVIKSCYDRQAGLIEHLAMVTGGVWRPPTISSNEEQSRIKALSDEQEAINAGMRTQVRRDLNILNRYRIQLLHAIANAVECDQPAVWSPQAVDSLTTKRTAVD